MLKLGEQSKNGGNTSTPNSSLSTTPTNIKGFFMSNSGPNITATENELLKHREKLIIHIGGQLASFVSARLDVIDLYPFNAIFASHILFPSVLPWRSYF